MAMSEGSDSSHPTRSSSFHRDNIALHELDESDEERELTNLNWLLRNQNLTWAKTIIDSHTEEHFKASSESHNSNIRTNQTKPVLLTKCVTKSQKTIPKRPSPSERYEIFLNKIKRDLTEYEKLAPKYETDVTEKPPFNYSHIIGMAMLKNGRVTLQEICSWIESKFAFFRVRKKWNNSIRHNLSLHHCFRNRKREEKKGKGGYWELGVDPKKCERKRIRNRKLCKQTVKDPNIKKCQKIIEPNTQMQNIAQSEEQVSLYTIYDKETKKIRYGEGEKSLYSLISEKRDTANMVFSSTFNGIVEPTSLTEGDNIQESCNITVNYDYSNFRPLIDSLDDQFHYLQNSGEYSRNDDILDNILDVCVNHY
ncbi:forkhead box protein J1-A [Drosophila serrata]|uniref:forkhead box protein J1-A n=1 Tax=Drosophila serrata TaxID=7274 RepID=UPI000A1D1B56|nr:forkhead box protein J1-A [Drosophila serrata]XP_020809944.1 forkhead box protein J1-A [Drosophila serrata]XP_020809946.1 forkhead box protein J1-A [Drosophila serrata]XP_020809947.1 forkhead box protein J1-A [Drosophila serrata]